MAKGKKVHGCAVEFTLDVLGGKWKTVILARLKHSPMRYGELRRVIPGLSDKMLSQRLRDMVDAGLIEPCCEEGSDGRYAATDLGRSLSPALEALYAWGEASARSLGAQVRGVTVDWRDEGQEAPLGAWQKVPRTEDGTTG